MFAIAPGAASLPGQWSAVSQCTNDGTTYAGLIDPARNGQIAVPSPVMSRACMLREPADKLWREAALV